MQPLGLGIIGLRHQHPRWYWPLFSHLPEYRPLAVSEEDKAFLDNQKDFYGLDAYTDYRSILDRNDIDVVLIFLPHSKMPEAVIAALDAGKHVIVEKPCAADLNGMERIAAAHKYSSCMVSAPYCWRNHPASERMREIVAGGLIGDITAAEARLNAGGAHRYVRDNCAWVLESREGGGPMWNLGVHWIDFLRWMTGKDVATVYGAVSGPFGEPERDIEDNAQAVMTFRNGAVAMLDISYGLKDDYPGKRDIYIALRGTLGSVSWAPAWEGTQDELHLVSEHFSMNNDKCRRIRILSKDLPGYGGQMGWAWLRDFAVSVREGHKPQVSVDDMLAAVRAADAFYRSVKSGKRVKIA